MQLTGYPPSVFTRAARLALHETGTPHALAAVDPFAGGATGHPFGRVPILLDGAVRIYETLAILTYLDRRTGGGLTPAAPLAAAREAQVASIASAYAYRPLVRQVYAARVFGPAHGEPPDEARACQGLAAAPVILDALEELAPEIGAGMGGLILAPMLDAFAQDREGAGLLGARPALFAWLDRFRARPSWAATAAWPAHVA